jgi:uncharacterized membrane protein
MPPIFRPDDATPLVHLYRGELARMTAYRTRLDTTTNWAIGATVGVLTFALGSPAVPHAIFLIPYALNLLFAMIEARRFQDFELSRLRVRLIERGLYAPQFGGGAPAGWAEALASSLDAPRSSLSLTEALAHRLRRNYLWLLIATYAGWLIDLWTLGAGLVQPSALGPVDALVVLGAGLALLLPWAWLAARSPVIEHG